MLSKEDKLEMLALLGQAINQKGGLVVQGTMIGEGGQLVVNQPVEVVDKLSQADVISAVLAEIRTVNGGLPLSYDNTVEYRYIYNATMPTAFGIWNPADVNNKVSFTNRPMSIKYLSSNNTLYIMYEEDRGKIYSYDADSWQQTGVFDTAVPTADDFDITIDANRLIVHKKINAYRREVSVFNKQFGTYILNQTFTLYYDNYWYIGEYGRRTVKLTPNGDAILAFARYTSNEHPSLATYSLKFGKYVRTAFVESGQWSYAYYSNSMHISPDGKYCYVTYRHSTGDVQVKRYTRDVNGNYRSPVSLQVPIGSSSNVTDMYVSLDERRIAVNNNGNVRLFKELNSIVEQTDPFSDGSMLSKYMFLDSLVNKVGSALTLVPMLMPNAGVSYTQDADIGKGIVFNSDTLLRMENTSALEIQNMTWAFNIKIATPSAVDNNILAYQGADYEAKARGIKIIEKAGKISVYHGSGDATWEVVADATNIADNEYHSVIVTIANGGTIKIYIDGLLTKEQAVTPPTISYLNSSLQVYIGGREENSNKPRELGKYTLNLLNFFKVALTAEQVKNVQTQRLRQPLRYELEQTIYAPQGSNTSWFGYGFTFNDSMEKLWINGYEERAAWLYEARKQVLLLDNLLTPDGWTLDANTSIAGEKMVIDHTTNDTQATHTINQLDISSYNVTIEYPKDTSGVANHKVIMTLGDQTKDMVLNDTGSTTVTVTIGDIANAILKIATDNTCNAQSYDILKITVARS